jgi:hypothetical protein
LLQKRAELLRNKVRGEGTTIIPLENIVVTHISLA